MRTLISTAGKTISKNSGQAYLVMLLVMAASLGLLAASFGVIIYSRAVQAEREKELIFRGLAYKAAIKSYFEAGVSKKELPRRLEDLLSDPRFSDKKHIRKLYNDPITRGDWVLIKNADGGITGVASSSKMQPLRHTNFPEALKSFENAKQYGEWAFQYDR